MRSLGVAYKGYGPNPDEIRIALLFLNRGLRLF
ncbi:hypothetical protein sync_0161 [Synechococcus sp. CC9311]|nr:hypothetical protein sync_0161 [Synechococcus sp. CC9311]